MWNSSIGTSAAAVDDWEPLTEVSRAGRSDMHPVQAAFAKRRCGSAEAVGCLSCLF